MVDGEPLIIFWMAYGRVSSDQMAVGRKMLPLWFLRIHSRVQGNISTTYCGCTQYTDSTIREEAYIFTSLISVISLSHLKTETVVLQPSRSISCCHWLRIISLSQPLCGFRFPVCLDIGIQHYLMLKLQDWIEKKSLGERNGCEISRLWYEGSREALKPCQWT